MRSIRNASAWAFVDACARLFSAVGLLIAAIAELLRLFR
jgi:hypothetical protein